MTPQQKLMRFSRSLLISGALVVLMGLTFFLYVRSELKVDRANEIRQISYVMTDELRYMLIALALALGLMFMLWRIYAISKDILGGSLDEVYAQISRMGSGDFSSVIELKPGQKSSVLGWLSATQAKLNESERERLQAEENVRSERLLSDSLINSLPGIFYLFDESLRFLRWNENFERVSGYSHDQVAALSPLDLFDGEDRVLLQQRIAAVFADGQSDVEAHLVSRTGERTPYCFTGLRIEFHGKRFLIGVGLDISKRVEVERQIRELNAGLEQRIGQRTAQLESAVKDLEGFSYSVSHDLRAPLRAIDNFSGILLEEHAAQLDAEGQRLLDVVRRNVTKMERLIDDILMFSRAGKQDLKYSRVDMAALAREVFDEIRAAEGARAIELRLATLPAADADRTAIRQVWANLLANALKFTRRRERAVIEVTGGIENGVCAYTVRDNGAGFDPQYGYRLFGVFQRLHSTEEFEGTGIGLAIVKRVLDKHGGQVWAEGEPGMGAVFHFTLPQREPQTQKGDSS